MLAINDRKEIGYSFCKGDNELDLVDYGEEYDPKVPSSPSDILIYAHENKFKKIESEIKDENGYCAVGVIKHLQEEKNFRMYHFFKQKYNNTIHNIGEKHGREVMENFLDLMKYNDSSKSVTFKDCAEFMKKKGF